jgi:hypothetical protein
MRKISDEKLEKLKNNDENQKAFEGFLRPEGVYPFMFAVPTGAENIKFSLEPPPVTDIKKKAILILRAKPPVKGGDQVTIDKMNIHHEVIFQEISKNVLENLH